ncbi:SusD/RagB family nutrient-binding outer membrane lipoprotein [Abyssalbus ytuae]|uniref:SusD/RagB family nutrient-binding outer membrane lipoprotein n=1 Tax=Abyssalbus ytuae TaxID=2926907 RepID=A0A9E7D145_9FLAO|nr:SusD/RagB family nutrient-binding outer membrane lipoprotein [Abyssalbus ytuae]UOB16673.1 SusD/RagB family nutrient-binding outer membrane lipoprotein [Abyssalbus ytuae]
MALNKKIIKYLFFSFLIFNMEGCIDDHLFRETNTNSEGFSSLNPNLLLTTVQASLSGGRFEQWRTNLIYGEGFVQHLGGSYAVSNYGAFFKHNAEYETALWQSNYGNGIIRNLIDIQEQTKNNETLNNLNAASKILKVMVFQRLTDTYGDIPYSEAGLGFYEGVYFPKYDDQQEIYNDFFVLLNEAYHQLNDDPEADKITGDNFYNGDISKWKKLANSLRLRCAMRIYEIDEIKAVNEINEAITNGLFENNDDNCFTHHDDTGFNITGAEKNGNGLSQALKGNGVVLDHPTEIILRNLADDPRLNIWFLPGSTGKIEGVSSNNFRWDHPGGSENLGVLQPYLYKNDAPYLNISYAETQLLLAEAVQRGFITGDAQSYYQKGIEASILQWSAYGADIDESQAKEFAENKQLTTGNEIEEIAIQQWLTLFMNGIEAYANLRRIDLPVLDAMTRTDTDTNGVMPKKLPYPGEEATLNPDNYEAASQKYPNGWLSNLWWDVN